MDALKAYIGLLPDFNGNIVFVHTKFDYARLHPDNTHAADSLKEKRQLIKDLMNGQTVSHLLIDNTIGT